MVTQLQQLDPRELLTVTIPETKDGWNEAAQRFFVVPHDVTITLEHSLVSVAKWEARHHPKKFFDRSNPRTLNEQLDYIRCMTIENGISPEIYYGIPDKEMARINNYINDPMSSTTISEYRGGGARRSGGIDTAETIYWSMIQCNIPIEWEHRHLNQLMMLIRVCMAKDNPKKMSTSEAIQFQASQAEKNKAYIRRMAAKGKINH